MLVSFKTLFHTLGKVDNRAALKPKRHQSNTIFTCGEANRSMDAKCWGCWGCWGGWGCGCWGVKILNYLRDLKFNYTTEKHEKIEVMIECIELLKVHPETQIHKIKAALKKLEPDEEFLKNKRQKV